MSRSPRLVVAVTGLPASGKSTLAGPLAKALDATLLEQDAVTEALLDVLGVRDRTWTRAVSRVGLDAVLGLIGISPRCVIDAWWPAERGRRLEPWLADLIEVRCEVPAMLAAARFARRVRHPGHHDDPEAARHIGEMHDYAGLGLPCPVVHVDTAAAVDVDDVARRVLGAGL